jgi:hypothetical protein
VHRVPAWMTVGLVVLWLVIAMLVDLSIRRTVVPRA